VVPKLSSLEDPKVIGLCRISEVFGPERDGLEAKLIELELRGVTVWSLLLGDSAGVAKNRDLGWISSNEYVDTSELEELSLRGEAVMLRDTNSGRLPEAIDGSMAMVGSVSLLSP
jgi:hypothetical protein